MDKQNQIKRTLGQPDSIETIRRLLEDKCHNNRTSVAKAVCRHFGFFDARSRMQTGGCVKALRELERAGHFVLPVVNDPSHSHKVRTPRRLDAPVALPADVPAQEGVCAGWSWSRWTALI